MKATLKIQAITERKNGYGMQIIEVISDTDINTINRGYNEFEPTIEIDESDLLSLRTSLTPDADNKVHLEIICPNKTTCAHYSLKNQYLGSNPNFSNIIWAILFMFLSFGSIQAQTSVKVDSKSNYIAVSKTSAKQGSKATATGKTYTDAKGKVYGVWESAKGKLFVIKTSASGKQYPQYISTK